MTSHASLHQKRLYLLIPSSRQRPKKTSPPSRHPRTGSRIRRGRAGRGGCGAPTQPCAVNAGYRSACARRSSAAHSVVARGAGQARAVVATRYALAVFTEGHGRGAVEIRRTPDAVTIVIAHRRRPTAIRVDHALRAVAIRQAVRRCRRTVGRRPALHAAAREHTADAGIAIRAIGVG
jgi:hypothetical protein